jgi:photosystem II stability/assembly factor-like uncharacterized protein
MMTMQRRLFTAAALCAVTGMARAAAYNADGAAKVRAGAMRSTLLDLVAAGKRLVAVGERGHVLLSDDKGKTWRQAKAVPTRATLTCVHATDATTLWAAGHGGVILRSADAGETWSIVTGSADGTDVLLCIRVEADGRGLAMGGFGIALATADGGKNWKPVSLLPGEAGEKHLNRLFVSPAGTWLIAGEGGQVLRSSDRGDLAAMKWTAVKTPYKGSLWTGLALPGGALLACGMRGNIVRSADDGLTWKHLPIAEAGSFTGAAALADGRPVLVGVDGTLVIGDAAGESFRLRRQDDRATLTALVVLSDTQLIAATTAGPRGIELPR